VMAQPLAIVAPMVRHASAARFLWEDFVVIFVTFQETLSPFEAAVPPPRGRRWSGR
jgi:hypothetical protein